MPQLETSPTGGPPDPPPGQGGNPPGQEPDYVKVIEKNVARLNEDLEPFGPDDRRRIMRNINYRVELQNTVQGTPPV